ncbi:hypothetical protein [uncultured Aquimarina sp.]|uniref:hypothetical protein n=1 Tax=uncultured Aquimarina sp. TaxID=575652 RepID=UPI00260898D3|nr:hypothetical protein [uncultured Aquimarina sp.]
MEFSKTNLSGLPYPLVNLTSSGLAHAYTRYSGEPNQYRVGEVVLRQVFGFYNSILIPKK